MKKCTKCGEEKELSEFHKAARYKDGHRSDCKECKRAHVRNYYSENFEKERERSRSKRLGRRKADKPWPNNPLLGYAGAHHRVHAVRGHATNYQCSGCGGQAIEWAYTYECPDEMTELKADARNGNKLREMAYSPNPSFYQAMCKACHVAFDKSKVGH